MNFVAPSKRHAAIRLLTSLTVIALACLGLPLFGAPAPGVDTLKAALAKKWKELLPAGYTDRTVLFQEVTPGQPAAGSYPFQVTALVHDYGPGYPKNRYYGNTCVGKFDKARFTLSPDGFGGWSVQGALTPSMENHICKPNPTPGVSSIPVNTLPGSSVIATTTTSVSPAPAASKAAAKVSAGRYECWANGRAQSGLNFRIQSSTEYVGSDGKLGAYQYDSDSGRIAFHGGALDGVMPAGFFALYYSSQGTPHLSFRNAGGAEASFCELVR